MLSLSFPVGQALKKARAHTKNASLAVTGLALITGVLSPAANAQQPHINHPLGSIATPEPSSWIAFAIGGLGLLLLARIAQKRRAADITRTE